MYDFMNFIEKLLTDRDLTLIKEALETISDTFHIGKITINSKDPKENLEIVISEEIDSNAICTYTKNDYIYEFYKRKDDYVFSTPEIQDINYMLKLISIHHFNYNVIRVAENSQYISPNTGLPNVHGIMRIIKSKFGKIDFSIYNSYFINIKGFGLINVLFGFSQGDKAIVKYAEYLEGFIEDDEFVGHLGGDNFVAIVKRTRHKQFVEFANLRPIPLEKDGEIKIVNLIGVIGYYELSNKIPEYGDIVSNSSIACQYARNNKMVVVKLTDEIYEMVNSIKNVERNFKDELAKGSFIVYYQPKFDMKSGKINGVEALARWMNNGKVVPPGVFVPVLEKNGEIVDLDLFVLESLCRDIHNYRNQGHRIVPASCNLSRSDFKDPDLEEKVINIIKRYNVKSEDIVIEVTETTNIEEKERLSKFIDVMNKNGIMTSIDDFGTGYSSLSVLRDFKVNEIKIDRSFINREHFSDTDVIIIGSIIDMAKRLNINVICEGVELEQQADFLMKLGCNNAQGFLYSKPLPKLEFEAMMQRIGTVWDE